MTRVWRSGGMVRLHCAQQFDDTRLRLSGSECPCAARRPSKAQKKVSALQHGRSDPMASTGMFRQYGVFALRAASRWVPKRALPMA